MNGHKRILRRQLTVVDLEDIKMLKRIDPSDEQRSSGLVFGKEGL